MRGGDAENSYGSVGAQLTDPVDHVDAVVEALHQLTLGLRGRLDEQLGGRHELPRLRGQQLLGARELGLAARAHVAVGADCARLADVDHDLGHHLLRLLEHDQPPRSLQRVVLSLGVIHAGANLEENVK